METHLEVAQTMETSLYKYMRSMVLGNSAFEFTFFSLLLHDLGDLSPSLGIAAQFQH